MSARIVLRAGAIILAFVLLLAAWALLSGGVMVVAAFRVGKDRGRWLLALGGVIGVGVVAAVIFGTVQLIRWRRGRDQ